MTDGHASGLNTASDGRYRVERPAGQRETVPPRRSEELGHEGVSQDRAREPAEVAIRGPEFADTMIRAHGCKPGDERLNGARRGRALPSQATRSTSSSSRTDPFSERRRSASGSAP